MKKSLASLSVLAAAISPAAMAEQFQMELTTTYANEEQDTRETDIFNIEGVAHFKTVSTEGHPLEEAAYLERSSYVSAAYTRTEAEINSSKDRDNAFDFALHLNTGERYFIDLGFSNSNEGDSDVFIAGLGFGAYVTDTVSVSASFLDAKTEIHNTQGSDISTVGYSIDGRGVFSITEDQAVSVDAGFTVLDNDNRTDNTETINLSARYYFLKTTHVGLGYSLESSDDEDTDGFSIEGQHFITPMIAVGASWGTEESDADGAEEEETASIWAKFRF